MAAAFIVAAWPTLSGAAARCAARANPRTGAIEVKASAVSGSPRWGIDSGATTALFADEASCFRRGRLKNCHLGAPDTLAESTPPPTCRLCVGDEGGTGCCAIVRGCTPGQRLGDGSFAAGDPRLGNTSVAGIWQRTAGGLFTADISSDDGAIPLVRHLDFLVLNADGTGRISLREPDPAVLTCGGLRHSRQSSSLLLDLEQIGIGARLVLVGQPDVNTLSLRDAVGESATFTRAYAVGDDCGQLTVNARFDDLPVEPDGFSGLVFDGSQLWYEEESTRLVFPVDPATGAFGAPVDLGLASDFSHVQAMQGADFWASCGCGDESIQRRTAAGVLVDTVDASTVLNESFAMDGAAFDPVGGVLYLHGFSYDRGAAQLLRIDSNAEPDVLLSVVDFPKGVYSMTWDGANLWALVGFAPQVVIRIDVDAAKAVATFRVPDTSVEWTGIASVGSQLFLVGKKNGAGVLVGTTPAAP